MTVMNPVAVEDAIREVSNRIANGVTVCDTRYRAFLAADREYDAAFARAYMAHQGAAHERRYAAEIATVKEREAVRGPSGEGVGERAACTPIGGGVNPGDVCHGRGW